MIDWFKLQFESWIEHRRTLQLRKLQCDSCESLKQELSLVHEQNRQLLQSLTKQPEREQERTVGPEITKPRYVPWHVKRQELEQRDRVQAEKIKKEREQEIKVDSKLEDEVINGKVN